MSYKSGFKNTRSERQYRRFSDAFKRKKVEEIEQGRATVISVARAYELSASSIYKWINKFGRSEKPERTIVESKSDTTKILALQKRIAELERMLGQKEVEIIFKDKMIDIAEEKFGIDIKKKSKKKR